MQPFAWPILDPPADVVVRSWNTEEDALGLLFRHGDGSVAPLSRIQERAMTTWLHAHYVSKLRNNQHVATEQHVGFQQ